VFFNRRRTFASSACRLLQAAAFAYRLGVFSFLLLEGNVASSHARAVSLCMIVRNEERELHDCLAPVAELFDEIIIVDTCSTDATKDVAARFTRHVFDFPWRDDFAAARNEALRHASGEWIFWLDADDRLSADNVARLKQVLGTLDDQPRAYMMQTAC